MSAPSDGVPAARILVVDDEDAIVELLRTLLEHDGHAVSTENDGAAAVARVRKERFDLVITDKNLPGSSGLDVIRAATESDPLVECMLVTGYGSMESAIAAMEAGAFDYILKPFASLGELRGRIRRALERQKLKADNRALVEFLEGVVRHMPSSLIVVDRDGRLRAINPPALATLGLGPEQAAEGAPLAQVLGETVAAAFLHPSEKVNGQTVPREVAFTRGDGISVGIGFTSQALLDPDGEATGAIVTFRDLSELKRLQEDERRRDRLAAMGEMSARIAHEIRNPLVSIDSVLRLLEQDLDGNESAVKDVDTIQREVRRLHGIVSEILQFSGRKPSALLAGDPAAVVRSVVSQVGEQFRAREVLLDGDVPALPDVPLDADRLRQVLLNLLLNALDATPANGRVAVAAARVDGGVRIRIDDSGPGIAPEVASRLFTPFFSTKTRGTGLGLAVCRGIVEEHRGRLSLDNRPDGPGARAELFLPMDAATAAPRASEDRGATPRRA